MSNCSDDHPSLRLFAAVSQECRIMADEIAWLGGLVSSGAADAVALQAFDFLAQHAQAQALLVSHLAQVRQENYAPAEFIRLVDTIPLPRVRARLRLALNQAAPLPIDDGDLVLWADA